MQTYVLKSHHTVKKGHKTVNLCNKKSQTSIANSQICKFF